MFYTCCACTRVSCEYVGIFPLSSSVGLNLVWAFVLESPQKVLTKGGPKGVKTGFFSCFSHCKDAILGEKDLITSAMLATELKLAGQKASNESDGWMGRFVQTSFLMNPWNILFPVVPLPPWQILVFSRHIAHLLFSTFLFLSCLLRWMRRWAPPCLHPFSNPRPLNLTSSPGAKRLSLLPPSSLSLPFLPLCSTSRLN